MEIVEEEMKQLIVKIKEEKTKLFSPILEVASYEQGYWTGYYEALNDILAELDKVPRVMCENLGMGFD